MKLSKIESNLNLLLISYITYNPNSDINRILCISKNERYRVLNNIVNYNEYAKLTPNR